MRNVAEVSRDLDRTQSTVRAWVQRTDSQSSKGGYLGAAEREELSRLRWQVRVLEEERTILKKAAAFFAEETRCPGIGSSRWRR